MMVDTPSVLCLASYEKGADFLTAAKQLGWTVYLLTIADLQHVAWPREDIDEVFLMHDLSDQGAVVRTVSYLARSRAFDRIIPLDEYDVEMAAVLREHMRLRGMNLSEAKLVRDKLAMRVAAHAAGIPMPAFTSVVNDAAVSAFAAAVSRPWLLKPRSEVSTIGINRVDDASLLWERLHALGDTRSHHLLEQYVPGSVYHVDSIIREGEVVFSEVHGYARPPLDVFHGGGLSSTRTLARGSEDETALKDLNGSVVRALGPWRGAAHAEFIRRHDGQFSFLEIGARVGGAYIANLVEAATGVNLYREWARVELMDDPSRYEPPVATAGYAATLVSLARQEWPDTSAYVDEEIVWRLDKRQHVGFVVASPAYERVTALLDAYTHRFDADFAAVLPPRTAKPSRGGLDDRDVPA